MALTHLVDTSVVTRLRLPAVREQVAVLAEAEAIGRASITDLEVGSSARNAEEWDRLLAALQVFPLAELEERDLTRAGQVQRLLAGRGLRGRKVPDLLVAAIAESRSLTVLHYDSDFDHITAVTGQPTAWVVSPGSVD